MATIQARAEPSIRLENLDWPTYESLLGRLEGQNVRLTYDRGSLTLKSPSAEHERYAYLLGRLVDIVTEELNIPMEGLRTLTCRREDLACGLEPDCCFYIANEPRVRGKPELDFRVDPPPDLAIEVDISNSFSQKLPIYAALGVPEAWRFDGEELEVHLLQPDGRYVMGSVSSTFPQVALGELRGFLNEAGKMDGTTWSKTVRAWVREGTLRAALPRFS